MVSAAGIENYGKLNVVLLNQDPDPAEPGRYVEFRWKVTKEGLGSVNDISFKLDPKYPFSLDASQNAVTELSDWTGYSGSDEYYILYYKVLIDKNAVEGTYDLDLLINMSAATTQKTYAIRVDDSKNPELVTGLVKTEPTRLVPDSTENKISVELLNLGVDDAELVVATLNLPEGFESTYSYSSVSALGTIAGGSSKNAVFYVDATESVHEGLYPATITLKYREEGETALVTKELPLSLEVKNKPMFKVVNVSYEPSVIRAGDSVKMKIVVVNTGSKDAESISLRAFKESTQPFDFDEKSDFIGTLKPGQEGTAIIALTADKDAPSKDYLMDLEIRSVYNGDVFTQSEVAKIDILAKQTGFFSRYWIAIITVIAAVIIVVYLTVKKK
jgi:hypothetical protein